MSSSPITITPLPPAPTTLDPTNFDSKADALLSSLPQMVTEMNSVAATTYSNALNAENAAATASVSGAPNWVSGNNYTLYTVVFSPITEKIYRCILTINGGTTDPSADPTHWKLVNFDSPIVYVNTSTVTCQLGYKYVIKYAGGSVSITGPASASDGDYFEIVLINTRTDNTFNPTPYTLNGVSGVCTLDNAYLAIKLQMLDGGWRISV